MDAAVDSFAAQGYEGVIARVARAVPRKRSLDLVKAKRFVQEEFAVTGFQSARSNRPCRDRPVSYCGRDGVWRDP